MAENRTGCTFWGVSKHMALRYDLTPAQKMIITVLIAALVSAKITHKDVSPTIMGVSKTLGLDSKYKPEFDELEGRCYITVKNGEITSLNLDKLLDDGIIESGSIPALGI